MVLLAITCEKTDETGTALKGEDPDLNLSMDVKMLLTAEQQEAIASFEKARHEFEDMTLDEFRTTYGPDAEYRNEMLSNPLDATNLELIQKYVKLSQAQAEAYETQGFAIL